MDKDTPWFVAVVTPNTERSSQRKLESLFGEEGKAEFETYVPVQRELRERAGTGRRVWADRVLCPCFLFVRCSDAVRYEMACRAKFILHFLTDRARRGVSGRPGFARIPHGQMVDFMRLVGDAESPVTIDSTLLRAGSRVRVRSGRFSGLEGTLERDPDGSPMLALRIDFLGYAKMAMPVELLEKVEEPQKQEVVRHH